MPKIISKSILFFLILLSIIGSYFYVLYLPWNPHWLDGKSFWYQLFWKGNKVGFVQVSYNYQQNGNFQINQLTRVKTINRGEVLELHEREVLTFDTNNYYPVNGELVASFYQRQQGDYLEHSQLELINGYLQGEKRLNRQITAINIKHNGYNLTEYLQLMNWPRENPLVGEILTSRRLDFSDHSLNNVTYKLKQKDQSTGNLYIGFHENNRSWQGSVELSATGTPQSYAVGQLVEQRLSSKEQAIQTYVPSDYYISQIISIDKTLGDVNKLRNITLSSPQLSEFGIVEDQRQTIDSNNQLHINRRSAFKEVMHHDKRTYLQQPYNKEVLHLSQRVVGKSKNSKEKVRQLLNFVSYYLVDAPITHPMTITNILQQRKGDCTEHTRLFNAMARALDIPARKVEGLVYLGDEIKGFGGHVWSEVVIDGKWVAVDSTWNLQQLSPAHIELDAAYKDELFNKMHKNATLSFQLEKIVN